MATTISSPGGVGVGRDVVLCVTTSHPSLAAATTAMSGGGGAMMFICPQTGSLSGSLCISGDLQSTTAATSASQQQQQLGLLSLSVFPPRVSATLHPSKGTIPLALGYGGKQPQSKHDGVAMLLSLHSATPKVHWKARLPEPFMTAGIHVSPCGHYAIGGGASGTLYVWSTLSGQLLQTVPRAHYRSITCLKFTLDHRHVISGGADGMVHVFALMDLVASKDEHQQRTAGSNSSIAPIRTWSKHSMPITHLDNLSDARIFSTSQDGELLIMEVCSQDIIATIKLPQTIATCAVHQQRIYVGGSLGTIFVLDLDLYSMHQTIHQLGASVARNAAAVSQSTKESEQKTTQLSYKTELLGHRHPITALTAWQGEDGGEFLASGDTAGNIRIWDVSSRVSVRIVRPWSSTNNSASSSSTKAGNDKKKQQQAAPPQHPISSLTILDLPDNNTRIAASNSNSMLAAPTNKAKTATTWTSRLPPLQKYTTSFDEQQEAMDPSSRRRRQWIPVPFWNAQRDDDFWNVTKAIDNDFVRRPIRKRPRPSGTTATGTIQTATTTDTNVDDKPSTTKKNSNDSDDVVAASAENENTDNFLSFDNDDGNHQEDEKDKELERLRKELQQANSTITRWEKVNNQLMAKLKQKS
jgi:WD40 repeat protein